MTRFLSLNNFQIKCLGLVLMTFDHIHQMFYFSGAPLFFTMLGRPVAILFIFLSAEGFFYTRNPFYYMKNLLIGFWLMSLCSTLIQSYFPLDHVVLMNSIFGTLFLTVLSIYCVDKILKGFQNRHWKTVLWGFFIVFLLFIHQIFLLSLLGNADFLDTYPDMIPFLIAAFPSFLTVEAWPLIFLGPLFYLLRKSRLLQIGVILIFAIASTGLQFSHLFSTNIQWMMIFSVFPILLYNGEKGKSMKWFFYAYYPLHIYVLYFLSYFYQKML